jgi:hypothetical protein
MLIPSSALAEASQPKAAKPAPRRVSPYVIANRRHARDGRAARPGNAALSVRPAQVARANRK